MENKKRIEEIIKEMEVAVNNIGNYSGYFRKKNNYSKEYFRP